MKISLTAAAVTIALALPISTPAALAGPVESACLGSKRNAATRATCSCIQQVADMTLRRADQRRAARILRDPDEAQKIRMSKSSGDNAFWARYRAFGSTAEARCTG